MRLSYTHLAPMLEIPRTQQMWSWISYRSICCSFLSYLTKYSHIFFIALKKPWKAVSFSCLLKFRKSVCMQLIPLAISCLECTWLLGPQKMFCWSVQFSTTKFSCHSLQVFSKVDSLSERASTKSLWITIYKIHTWLTLHHSGIFFLAPSFCNVFGKQTWIFSNFDDKRSSPAKWFAVRFTFCRRKQSTVYAKAGPRFERTKAWNACTLHYRI